MTAIARTDVAAAVAKAEPTDAAAKPGAKTDATTKAPVKQDGDFAKQLQKATKPVVKKPTMNLGDATQVQAQATADTSPLAQIIAAIMNTAGAVTTDVAVDAQPDQPDRVDLKTAIAGTKATTTDAAPDTAQNALLEQMIAVKPEAAPLLAPAQPPLTPLEQAVHDMLSDLADKKQAAADPTTAQQSVQLVPTTTTITPAEAAIEVQHAERIAQPQPQELVSQNHAHLVIDDPNGRVVMTVAIRGENVNVTVRASDDSTAAALARNAGSLEDAMRGRGLALAQFDSQRDLAREQHDKDKPAYRPREKQPDKSEAFTLEENP